MIVDLLFSVVILFEQIFLAILPTWSPYPAEVLTSFSTIAQYMAKFNFIFPIDTLFTVLVYFINFEIIYYSARLIMKIANYIRGTGSGIDI